MKSKKLALSLNLVVILAIVFGMALPFMLAASAADVAYAATSSANSSADWVNQYEGTYYNNVNENLTGTALRSQVAKLVTDTHKHLTHYDDLKSLFYETDADPNKNGNIIWFYTGTSVPFKGTWDNGNYPTNREHVWPKNGGSAFPEKTGPGGDAHHIRPLNSSMNSTRGSMSYDEVTKKVVALNGSTSYGNLCYTDGTFFYPGEGYRGATARILFYLQTRWGDQYNLSFVDGSGHNKTIGKISTLMKWHLQEPPTDEEIRRNEVVFAKQGNRNPFIDHPEYATAIYCNDGQSYNNALKQVVATYGDYNDDRPEVENLTLNSSSLNLFLGESQTLTATVYPSNASAAVNWTSSDTSVAVVNNGVVTAKGNGTATITATSVSNPSVTASATVLVREATSIELAGEPIKKIYEVGEKFDPFGLTVRINYSDGSTETFDSKSELAQFGWTDANTGSTLINQSTTKIKCKYGNIEIISNWSISIKTATSIELVGEPNKKAYDVGDRFDPTGLTVRVHYNDGTHIDYSSAAELREFSWTDSVTGSDLLDKNSGAIKCAIDKISVVSTWKVSVRFVQSIQLIGEPLVKEYQAGQSFNPIGITVKLIYSDNSTQEYSSADNLKIFKWVDADTDNVILLQNTNKIKVEYQGVSQIGDWTIRVETPPDSIGAFLNSVVSIQSAKTLQERFDAIKTALIEYSKLSAEDKNNDGTIGAYEILQQAIGEYNADVSNENSVMENATKTGAYAICGVTLAAIALAVVLNRKFN